MDNLCSIYNLKEVVKTFCELRDWTQFHDPKELSILISTEAGELLQIFRFKDKEQMLNLLESSKRESVEDELADILFGLLRFAQLYDIDLSDALYRKIKKNNEKYPVELSKSCNNKYNE